MQEMLALPPNVGGDQFSKVNRLTVLIQVIRQSTVFSPSEEPVSLRGDFVLSLKSPEQTFRRLLSIGPTRQKLDLGWVRDAGMVVIKNTTTWEGALQPTADEVRDVKLRSVWIGPSECPDWLEIPLGCAQPLLLPATDDICIRSAHKDAKVEILAVSR